MPADLLRSALFSAIDPILANQPGVRASLARQAGKQARLRLPLFSLVVRVTEAGGLAAPDPKADVAAEITLTPANLFALILGDGTALSRATVNGDGVLATDIAAALARFDWALALRPYVGDIAAARAAEAIAGLSHWRAEASLAVGRGLAEYLSFETDVLADKAAVRGFITAVDALRDDVARFEARLAYLEQEHR